MVVVSKVRTSFIRTHLVKNIFLTSEKIMSICGVSRNSFVYFNEPIQTSYYKIDRFGKGYFYFKDQILPVSWTSIDGNILLNAYNQIKNNKVFCIKDIDNKLIKIRAKDVRK
jgi:hypothetical protein